MKQIGKYFIFLGTLFVRREKLKIYLDLTAEECIQIGLNSIVIISIVATFMGAVTSIQTAHNLISPLVPKYTVATVLRDMTILELAPTIMSVVLAGKVGSNIAGQLGTMKITEQIDALEVMGINSISYLVVPKIIASMIVIPMLVILAIFLSFVGGYVASVLIGELLTAQEFKNGLRLGFVPFNVIFAITKAVVFAFLISSISSFKGYYTQGGALEVGKSSTSAVTTSCIAVLLADYLLAQLIL